MKNQKNNAYKINLACRLLFGVTFIFSGFVKAIDPLGFSYKMQDYLEAWDLLMFSDLTLAAAVAMSAVEFAIGCCVLFGVRLREASWLGLAFMAFYTPLTLYVAIENPVTDCGCFGEALVITNWQTFWKNVVLLVLIIVVLATHKLQRIRLTNTPSWILTGLFFAISIAFSAYCLHYLPIIDFRPYKIGANIAEGMEIPENAPRDEYKTTFIYEKNGIEKEFTLQDYPWQDTTWHFVDQRSELIRAGYVPPIHDFSVTTMDGDDITSDVLTSDEICLIIMYDLQKTDTQNLQKVFEFANNRAIDGAEVLALTATYEGEIERFKEQTRMPWRFCATDPIQLKTIVRANPGIVVLKKGVVVEKYSHTQL